MSPTYTEEKFEDHIEIGLLAQGYRSASSKAKQVVEDPGFAYAGSYQPDIGKYDKEYCLLPNELIGFIQATQPETWENYRQIYEADAEHQLCKRVSNEIGRRDVVTVLREGIKDRGCHFSLVYFEPKSGMNPEHAELFKQNRFTVVRQLQYSQKNNNSIDTVLFINGIPIVTLELKNQLTGQTIKNAEYQYRHHRSPKEPLLKFKRCLVHFCVDNDWVSMTTQLAGESTKFLPYNKGIENPVPESGHKTQFLWNEILTPASLLDIIENFAHVAIEQEKEYDPKKKKVVDKNKELLIFPRYHQIDAIRQLREAIKQEGPGHNYLIQHATGSGKSYSIGWLAHLLTSLYQSQADKSRTFDTIIVVTDRRALDAQLRRTIQQLEQTPGIVNPVENTSQELKDFLEKGKDIITTTVQKFPVISQEISRLKSKTFAVIIDEVHSSQSGETSKHMKLSLSKSDPEEEENEKSVNDKILEEIEARGSQNHISFFGFSGTPKEKTLQIFGRKQTKPDGQPQYLPFHTYTMKQSIAEGFTLNVLENYTTYKTYFKLRKAIEDEVELPKSKVTKKLVQFAEDQPETISRKVAIMLHHFETTTKHQIKGKARAMVVTRSRQHCVYYKREFDKQMAAMNLPYRALVAFSGTVKDEDTGEELTESNMNKLAKGINVAEALKYPENRVLIVAFKYQTGYDEPLLHTMFVDKKLGGLQAVQTLSRLNRTMSGKDGTFVLDFVNSWEEIKEAFEPFYDQTYLEGETDPNKLYNLETDIKEFHLFTNQDVEEFAEIFYDEKQEDEQYQPILNNAVEQWRQLPEDDEREQFRSLIQSYIRLYSYIMQIGQFKDPDLEKLFVFLKNLNKKLPKRPEDPIDTTGLVDLDSLRIQKIYEGKIELEEGGGQMEPTSEGGSKGSEDPELDTLSNIVETINDVYGIELTEEDKLDLQKVTNQVHSSEELAKTFQSNNSEANKKHKLEEVLDEVLLKLVDDRLDFYNKVNKDNVRKLLVEQLFTDYKDKMKGA